MDATRNDGGPAFPLNVIDPSKGHTEGRYEVEAQHAGMSLRDWFAAQALAARWKRSIHDNEAVLMTATLCYQMADAMLAVRGGK